MFMLIQFIIKKFITVNIVISVPSFTTVTTLNKPDPRKPANYYTFHNSENLNPSSSSFTWLFVFCKRSHKEHFSVNRDEPESLLLLPFFHFWPTIKDCLD